MAMDLTILIYLVLAG